MSVQKTSQESTSEPLTDKEIWDRFRIAQKDLDQQIQEIKERDNEQRNKINGAGSTKSAVRITSN